MKKDITDVLIDRYVDAIKSAKDRKAEKLKELGYHPDSVLTISRAMIDGVEMHMINKDVIIEDRMKRGLSREEAVEDYEIFKRKAASRFDHMPLRINGKLDFAAFYDWDNERYEMRPDTYQRFVAGYGKNVEVHEKKHRKQHEKYGMGVLNYLPFLEGDAELAELEELSSEKDGIKEMIRDFVGLKKIYDECYMSSRLHGKYYINYLLAPAIMFEMKKQGKSEKEIKRDFENAYKNGIFFVSKLTDCLSQSSSST